MRIDEESERIKIAAKCKNTKLDNIDTFFFILNDFSIFRVRSHGANVKAKAMSLLWVHSILCVIFTLSEFKKRKRFCMFRTNFSESIIAFASLCVNELFL